nr:hypothetical protein [uncultured Noviherbaspirillum sp.]
MKRTNSAAHLAPIPTLVPANTPELPGIAATYSDNLTIKKIVPYLADDVHKRILNLASDRERSSNRFDVKLQPKLHTPDPERLSFFDYPGDTYKNIFPRLSQHQWHLLKSSCHRGAQLHREAFPMYPLPGLLGDLKRLRVKNLSVHPEGFKAYLEAIAAGGAYDRVLLTPMSNAHRCAVAVAMQLWAHSRKVHRNDYTSLVALTVKFIDKNYDVHFLDGMKDVFHWHLVNTTGHLPEGSMLRKLFNVTNLDRDTKSLIFQKFLEVLCETHFEVTKGLELISLAQDFDLKLTVVSTGILAFLEEKSSRFMEMLPILLHQLSSEESRKAVFQIINFGISKKLFESHSIKWLLSFTQMLGGATREFSESDRKIILIKIISIYHQPMNYCNFYDNGSFDMAFDSTAAQNPELAPTPNGDEDNKGYETLYSGYLLKLLADCASELRQEDTAPSLLQEIYKIGGGPETSYLHFKSYMENKLALCVGTGQAD